MFKRISDKEIDNCSPTDDEIQAWLNEPDDNEVSKVIGMLLTPEQKVLIAKRVVMCRKVADAQLSADQEDYNKDMAEKDKRIKELQEMCLNFEQSGTEAIEQERKRVAGEIEGYKKEIERLNTLIPQDDF